MLHLNQLIQAISIGRLIICEKIITFSMSSNLWHYIDIYYNILHSGHEFNMGYDIKLHILRDLTLDWMSMLDDNTSHIFHQLWFCNGFIYYWILLLFKFVSLLQFQSFNWKNRNSKSLLVSQYGMSLIYNVLLYNGYEQNKLH